MASKRLVFNLFCGFERYLNRRSFFIVDLSRYSTLAFPPSPYIRSPIRQSTLLWQSSRHYVKAQNFSTPAEQSEQSPSGSPTRVPPPQAAAGSLSRNKCLVFTCKRCGLRQAKWFSAQAYERGVVLARCGIYPDEPNAKPVEGCGSIHLIADNLGWFAGSDKGIKNIEQLMRAKGERVQRFRVRAGEKDEALVEPVAECGASGADAAEANVELAADSPPRLRE